MEKIKITINGHQIETDAGKTILQAALENNIHIPHYCYHPGLPIAGNCRMCLVEIEGIPKLQTSCSTVVRDGMIVHTNNERVKTAVKHVLEFLLINHPLDCPVCDQAGECGLQDYYMEYGRYDSRFAENKVLHPKKAFPIGKWVMLDQDRCIKCARCVRFTREVSKTNELALFYRGDKVQIDTFPGKTLDNRYSANVVDICPVGALTSIDFRFKCRVWYLKSTNSICPGCSRGCNIIIDHNPERPHKADGKRVMRLRPRENPGVNSFWMCDDGRFGYHFIDDNRLTYASIAEGVSHKQIYLHEAISYLTKLLEEYSQNTLVLLSANSTNEELYAAKSLFKDKLGTKCLLPDSFIRTGDEDELLIKEDKHPNTRGVEKIFNIDEKDLFPLDNLLEYVKKNNIKLLIINRHEISDDIASQLETLDCRIVYMGTNKNNSSKHSYINIPVAVFAEKEGTFTNFFGLIQRIHMAVPPLGQAEPEWNLYSKLSDKLNLNISFSSVQEVFEDMSKNVPFFKNIRFEQLEPNGVMGSNE